MPDNADLKHYAGVLQDRHRDFLAALDQLMRAMVCAAENEKSDHAKNTQLQIERLRLLLKKEAYPQWVEPLRNRLKEYAHNVRNFDFGALLIVEIGRWYTAIKNQEWDMGGVPSVDFDAVYDKHYRESKIPELFDKLVELLEKIVESKEVDSRKLVQELEKLIATIRKNRNGSFFATMGTWQFARSFFTNVLWETLSSIPVLNVPFNALRKTVDEIDSGMAEVHQKTSDELKSQVHSSLPMLEYKRPKALPGPASEGSLSAEGDG